MPEPKTNNTHYKTTTGKAIMVPAAVGGPRPGTPKKPATLAKKSSRSSRPSGNAKFANTAAQGTDAANLHVQLHALSRQVNARTDEQQLRETFRNIILEHTEGIGVGHVVMDEFSNWDLAPQNTSGRVPRRNDFVEKFASCCNTTVQRGSIQIEKFLGLDSIYVPIQIGSSRPEVLLLLTEEANTPHALFVLEIAVAYLSLWLKEIRTSRSTWKLTSLAALIELVSQIESQPSADNACQVAASELARYLNCGTVAIALLHKGRFKAHALSDNGDVNRHSEAWRAFETTLNEALLRNEKATWPSESEQSRHLLLAHEQLAKQIGCGAVHSRPLKSVDDSVVGAIVLTGEKELIQGDRLPNFLDAASPRIASALSVVQRAEQTRWQKIKSSVKSQLQTVKGRVWYGAAAVVVGLMLMPVPYRVRCGCQTETTTKRYAVAPFDGLVKRGFVRPGDIITAGQLLAEMDGQQIRLELASVVADANKSRKQREIELSSRNVSASLLAGFETERLQAKQQQLEAQQEHIEIRSPLDGVVVSGSLEKSEGASVRTGDVLFEVAPLESLKIDVAIPASEIAHVRVGDHTRVWIDGMESKSFSGNIERIHPQSELRDGRNVFVAEVTVENQHQLLRPGMQGHARVDGPSRPLAWNLFHKPWNYVTSRMTWW